MGFIKNNIGHKNILKPLDSNKSKRQSIGDLLLFADQNVPFYKGKFSNFLNASNSLTDSQFWEAYTKLPITTKQDLKDHNADFMASQMGDCYDLIREGNPPTAIEALYHLFLKRDFKVSISTGGTSGIPTYRWLDYGDANVMAQSFLESFHQNGWRRGENFVLYYPMKSYFTDSYAAYSDWLHRLFGFSVVPFEQVTLESVKQLLKTMKDRKANLLVIFPCVMQRVAEIMHDNDLGPFKGLQNINVSGEFFLDCSKSFIQEMFPDSRIEITYGAVEVGELAHQDGPSSFDYKVFPDFAYIEEGNDDSLLVTSLQQTAFPMIRYKMEDFAQVKTDKNGQQYLKQLEGKNTDYLIGTDNKRHYATFFNMMVNDLNEQFGNPIIHFSLRHQAPKAQMNFILKHKDELAQRKIIEAAIPLLQKTFPQFEDVSVHFPENFEHDYTRKFKIIGEGDGLAEVVGGYYKQAG